MCNTPQRYNYIRPADMTNASMLANIDRSDGSCKATQDWLLGYDVGHND